MPSGFTLPETLIAVGVLGIALAGLLTAMVSGFSGVDAARRSSTALFLAEQRMEQLKAYALSTSPGQGWANLTSASFPPEAYGAVPGYADYRRQVTVTDNPGGAPNTKQVEVVVFYRPVTTQGIGAETSVVVSTLLVAR